MKLPIPAAALEQHVIALGKTGSGKSSKMRVLVEGLLDADEPVCIIDPKGDWWGIKASADGKRAGYPVVIFGGEHADVPLNARAGAQVAELVAGENRPCLLDLGPWMMVGERTRFFIDFAAAFFKHARGKRHLVIDEVHKFAPQGRTLDIDAAKALHWSNTLASEGRGRGITLIAASQRPQKVHKDFLTSCETLIACRVIHKLDRDAIRDWIDGCADPVKGKEVLQQLATMPRDEAWVWSPEIDFGPKRLAWPMFSTYDSFKPQEPGAAKLKGWADVDLEKIRKQLDQVVKDSEANDPKRLRARIAELERTIAKGGSAPRSANREELKTAEERGHERGLKEAFSTAQRLSGEHVRSLKGVLHKAIEELMTGANLALPTVPAARVDFGKPLPNPIRRWSKSPRNGEHSEVNGSLPKGEVAILAACIQFPEGLRREQLTVLTGYKRSTRDAYIQRLGEKGYVFIAPLIRATEEGRKALPDAEPLPTGEDLQRYWFERLPEGESKILQLLVTLHPSPVSRDALTERTGYKRSTRDAYLQRLAAKQLVTEPARGAVAASEDLF